MVVTAESEEGHNVKCETHSHVKQPVWSAFSARKTNINRLQTHMGRADYIYAQKENEVRAAAWTTDKVALPNEEFAPLQALYISDSTVHMHCKPSSLKWGYLFMYSF